MPSTKLPPGLVSLVHHIELNKAGWWDRGTQRLILAAVWISQSHPTPAEVRHRLLQDFRLDIGEESFKRHVSGLCGSDSLVVLPGGQLKITESARKRFEETISEAEELEARAKARFIVHLREFCQELDCEKTWRLFGENFLWPMVREVGARTYQLITGTEKEWDTTTGFQSFLALFPAELRSKLASAVISFLDPKDPVTRSYVLRHLNTYFFLEAGNLERPTIDALTKLASRPPSFGIFVDTNFIFSILQLRENPSNEAANLLMALIAELKGKVAFRLYASSLTLDETRRSLTFHSELLQGLALTPNLAQAAIADDLDGIARTYLDSSQRSSHPVQSEDYFAPYLKDLVSILRGRGVEFYNQSMDTLKVKQEVIDDILAEQEFEKRKFENSPKPPKNYEKLEHDITLWHFARTKRPAVVESPLDAQYWIVTLDRRLLSFDERRTRSTRGGVPVCLHPTSLIQMLQFWMPRTPEFEEAMLGSLRWPFLTQDFDPEAERVTIRILQTLNRFENVGDLPTDVVGAILVKEALRQKVSAERDPEKRVALVREALIEENKKASMENENVRLRLGRVESERDQLRTQLASTQDELSASNKQKLHAESDRGDVEKRFAELESQIQAQNAKAIHQKEVRRFARFSVVAFFLLFGLGLLAAWDLKAYLAFWRLTVAFEMLAAVAWVWFMEWTGKNTTAVNTGKFYRAVHRVRKGCLGVGAAVIVTALSETLVGWGHVILSRIHLK